ncbi:hypothetical protein DMN91_002387 [Ooceraea biroi]|uniref:PH domain-containing protein n=1 Tax=Ooceraea biroi TaxID=2015173 RepID=A0A026WA68_OOCBI|nr:uncharacterized protein LOC105281305 [Ooceraea biroi]EZA52987.1 hypothetical protein X777_07164 [Ooceraea biroi]RLU24299.1 hypothetical protein DMN91_002387 [Ooceraea biroi]
MSADDREICGFLDVKSGKRYTAQRFKKKALLSSKIWKRLWCSVTKFEPGLGVQVQFDSKFSCSALKQCENGNCVIIPPSAVIYRVRSKTKQFAFGIASTREKKPILSLSANSETETQRWMANIRHLLKPRRYSMGKLYVSIVDNAHSKAAGLIGLHGDLIASENGILIKNIYTSETLKSFEWKEFSHFHLMTAGRPEDVKRICVIHTTREFCCGVGELYMFCLDANYLLQDLVTQGRGPKSKRKSMDLDNENVDVSVQRTEITNPCKQLKGNASHCTLNTKSNCLRTSICTKTIENMYQSEPNVVHSEDKDSSSHAESNTSTGSGIYEEIVENVYSSQSKTEIISNEYQNIRKNLNKSQTEPPPLPPRRRQKSKRLEEPEEILNVRKRLRKSTEMYMQEIKMDSSYVPMSPQTRNINVSESNVAENSREDSYVIMR